ncbi:MAG: hypothetical protein AMXMBFR64_17430 [Myxococcales bacterium]
MAICFGIHPDGACHGPQPDLADDKVTGTLCDTCKQLRWQVSELQKHDPEKAVLVQKQMKDNERRLNTVRTLIGTRGKTGGQLQREITEKAEETIKRMVKRVMAGAGKPPARWAFLVCGSIARREAVTFSDIDALWVLENDDPATIKWFQDLAIRMQQVLWESGGDSSQFKFCPGGLSPMMILGTPAHILDKVRTKSSAGDHHMLAALQSRFLAGDQELAQEYEESCHGFMSMGKRQSRDAALAELERHLAKRDKHFLEEGWALPDSDDPIVNVKAQLYRPVHMIVAALAQYYELPGLTTREQILGLVEADHMSLRVAMFLFNTLDDVARLRAERQLEANTEYELIKTRELRKKERWGTSEFDTEMVQNEPLANLWRQGAVAACRERVAMFWELAEIYVRQKKAPSVGSQDNPFNVALMPAAKFAAICKVDKARVGWALRHPTKKHPLVRIHEALDTYHKTQKQMLRQRYELLQTIIDVGEEYAGKKSTKVTKKERKQNLKEGVEATLVRSAKVQAVLDLVENAKERIAREKAAAQELAQKVAPKQGLGMARVHRGLRFERAAKPGGVAITGADLYQRAKEGWLGSIELSPNESDDAHDLYALRKLLSGLREEDIDSINERMTKPQQGRRGTPEPLKKLEYSDRQKQAEYAVTVTADKLLWTKTKAPVDTMTTAAGDPPNTALYAMSADGDLYARCFPSREQRGVFQHSSFLSGEDALCAGTLKVRDGHIIEISNLSGHYQPTAQNLIDACWALTDEGYWPANSYALVYHVDEAVMQNPRATAHFRIPIGVLALNGGLPDNLFDFEVCAARDAQDGIFRYTDKEKARTAHAYEEDDEGGKVPPRARGPVGKRLFKL